MGVSDERRVAKAIERATVDWLHAEDRAEFWQFLARRAIAAMSVQALADEAPGGGVSASVDGLDEQRATEQ
jgi:hypothetical protein